MTKIIPVCFCLIYFEKDAGISQHYKRFIFCDFKICRTALPLAAILIFVGNHCGFAVFFLFFR